MAFTKRAAEVWRDDVVPFNPLFGKHKPAKPEIRQWGLDIEDAINAIAAATGIDPSVIPNLRLELLSSAARDTGRALAEIGESPAPFVAASIGNPVDAGIYSQTAPADSTFFDGVATFSDGALTGAFAFIRTLGSGQATLVFAMPNADGSFTAAKRVPVTVTSAGAIGLKAGVDFPAMSVRSGWVMGWYAPPGGAQIGFAGGGASRSCAGIPALGQTLALTPGFATLGLGAQYAGVGVRPVGYAAQAGAAAPTATLWANTNAGVRFTRSRLGVIRLYIQEAGDGQGNLVFLSPTGGWRVERVIHLAGLQAGLNTLFPIRDYPPVDVGDGWALGYYAEDNGARIAFVYNGDNSGCPLDARPAAGQLIPFVPSATNFSVNVDQIGSLSPVADRVDAVEDRLSAIDAGVSSLQASAALAGIQTATADRIVSCATSLSGRTLAVSGTMLRAGSLLPFSGSVTLDAPTSGSVTDEAQTLTANGGTAWPFAPVRLANANVSGLVVRDASTRAVLPLGTEYQAGLEHGTLVRIPTGSRAVLVSYTWSRRRYDAVMLDPVSMTLSVVKGAERVRDAQEFVPADPAGGVGPIPIRLCNVRVASSLEVIPTWSVEGGIPRALSEQFLRDQRRSWNALSATRSLIAAGLPVPVAAHGDSIVAIQYDVPSKSTPNGQQRDRATSLGGTQTYLPDALSPDAYAGLPLYDTGDGAGRTHTQMSLAWTLVRAIQAAGSPVTYLNFGVAGETSTGGNQEPWLSAVLTSGAKLIIRHFGQNELGDPLIEARTRIFLGGAYARGIDVIVVAPERTNAQGGVDDALWLTTVRALRRAAEWVDPATGKSAAFVDTAYLYADVAMGLGIARNDHCGANLYNHPGLREHDAVGRLAARMVTEGLVSVGRGVIEATKDGIGLGHVDNLSAAELASPGNAVGDAIAQALRPNVPGFNDAFSAAIASWMGSLPTASSNPDDPAPVGTGLPYKLGPGGPVVIAQ